MNFNSLPNDKILDSSKMTAFADDKLNVTEMFEFVLDRIENIVGTRCVCETLLPPRHPSFEKLDPDI